MERLTVEQLRKKVEEKRSSLRHRQKMFALDENIDNKVLEDLRKEVEQKSKLAAACKENEERFVALTLELQEGLKHLKKETGTETPRKPGPSTKYFIDLMQKHFSFIERVQKKRKVQRWKCMAAANVSSAARKVAAIKEEVKKTPVRRTNSSRGRTTKKTKTDEAEPVGKQQVDFKAVEAAAKTSVRRTKSLPSVTEKAAEKKSNSTIHGRKVESVKVTQAKMCEPGKVKEAAKRIRESLINDLAMSSSDEEDTPDVPAESVNQDAVVSPSPADENSDSEN